MKIIATVFKKELIDSLRDRRTLVTMIVIPLLLFPVLIGISSRMMMSQAKKAREKVLTLGLETHGNASDFRAALMSRKDMVVIEGIPVDVARKRISGDSLDAYLEFDPEFDQEIAAMQTGRVTYYFKSKEEIEIRKGRITAVLEEYERELRDKRFGRLKLDPSVQYTLNVTEMNLASAKERLAEAIGGFLPYLFIIFCFMGAMYPAIDLAAGEKERGTMETLLTTPADRFQILVGKFGVVVLTGIISAAVSILGLYLGVRQVSDIPPELLSMIFTILELRSIVLMLTLLLPLTVFFAAILLSFSFYARSFKEAQSILSPLMIVVVVPAFIGLMPGMELTPLTALIPVLNVSLATKAILAGTVSTPLLAEVYLSLVVFAGISLLLCTRVFRSEGILFRGT